MVQKLNEQWTCDLVVPKLYQLEGQPHWAWELARVRLTAEAVSEKQNGGWIGTTCCAFSELNDIYILVKSAVAASKIKNGR